MKTQKLIICQKAITLAQALSLSLLLNTTVHPHSQVLLISLPFFDRTESPQTAEVFRVLTSMAIFLYFSYVELGAVFYNVDPKRLAFSNFLRKKKKGKTAIRLQSTSIRKGKKNKLNFLHKTSFIFFSKEDC